MLGVPPKMINYSWTSTFTRHMVEGITDIFFHLSIEIHPVSTQIASVFGTRHLVFQEELILPLHVWGY